MAGIEPAIIYIIGFVFTQRSTEVIKGDFIQQLMITYANHKSDIAINHNRIILQLYSGKNKSPTERYMNYLTFCPQ